MQSAFEFKNGIKMIVFTTSSKICSKICNKDWVPIEDYASADLLDTEESYHKTLRKLYSDMELNPEHSTKFEENIGCPFDDEKTFNPETVSDHKGTYVRRSVYQKVVEENKKLLNDIRILTGDLTTKSVMLGAEWKERFRKDSELKDFIREIILGSKSQPT